MDEQTLRFTVSGCPVPKQRARKTLRGHWYTPTKTVHYERLVGLAGNKACTERLVELGTYWPKGECCTYALRLDVYLPDRRNRDIDNIAKSVMDGLNKTAVYVDDRQIKTLGIAKHVSKENPRVDVEIIYLGDEVRRGPKKRAKSLPLSAGEQ